MIGRIHLPLFLFALLVAVVVKVAVHQSLQLSEIIMTTQVRYATQEDRMILDPVQEVKVRLRGPSNEIAELNPLSVAVEVALGAEDLGLVDITEDRIAIRTPGQLEVVSIDPNGFQLNVEPRVSRLVPLRVELTGEPSAGAEHDLPRVRPESVEVDGPQSRVRDLDEILIKVSLDGRAISFSTSAPVPAPDPLVRITPRQVEVSVDMRVPFPEGEDGTPSSGRPAPPGTPPPAEPDD